MSQNISSFLPLAPSPSLPLPSSSLSLSLSLSLPRLSCWLALKEWTRVDLTMRQQQRALDESKAKEAADYLEQVEAEKNLLLSRALDAEAEVGRLR